MPQKYNHDLVTLRPQTSNTCKKSTNEHKVIRKILQIFKKYTLLFQPFCYWIVQCNKLLLTIYCRTLDVKSSPALNFSGICHMQHRNLSCAPRRLRLRLRLRIRLFTISRFIMLISFLVCDSCTKTMILMHEIFLVSGRTWKFAIHGKPSVPKI